ncbi:hypothetical protein HYH02_009520 [Chlamydomonas schloesseri]|uniref:Uncharacterized protein n=1 Tax=Chlamydomonas schloesseri TaxID=2026947 RepID=A0A835TCT2_9CHLO|nr:hypothetical protein HYH02_009520 [Chlamydomonas schloesseri]|eukprot:KAG2443107.1 hypothetical protein HYH02_009520 [Chlamydomonas schloesseri]
MQQQQQEPQQQGGGGGGRGPGIWPFGGPRAAPRRGRDVKDAFEAMQQGGSGCGGGGQRRPLREELADQGPRGDGDGDQPNNHPHHDYHHPLNSPAAVPCSGGQGIADDRKQQQGGGSSGSNGSSGGGGGGGGSSSADADDEARVAAARRRGGDSWARRVSAAFTAKAGDGKDEEGANRDGAGSAPKRGSASPHNTDPADPAAYADGKIHSGSSSGGGGSSRIKEPSGKEIKDQQYLKTYQEPHTHIQHIQGANFNWDRNKDREMPQATVETDNPTYLQTFGRHVEEKITGEAPEGTGIPVMRGTQGGMRHVLQPTADMLQRRLEHAPDTLPEIAARTEESVVGVLEHVSDAAAAAAGRVANVLSSGMGDYKTPEERMEEARRVQEEREVEYEQDAHPGAPLSSAVRQRRLEQMMAAGDPARKRDTLVDKLLYPWSKEAGTDTRHAEEVADSYHAYLREKRAAGEPYDPLGAMAHDRAYDTAKLPATVQQVDRSIVDVDSGQRSGDNTRFLEQRAPHAGQAPLPDSAREALRSLVDDTAAHGRPVVAGAAGLKERVEEEEARGGQRGALKTRGTDSPYNNQTGPDAEAYRDPHSRVAWAAADTLQDNIRLADSSTAAARREAGVVGDPSAAEGSGDGGDVMSGAAQGVKEAAGGVAERVKGAAAEAQQQTEGAVAEAERQARGLRGAAEGAAEVAGQELRRGAGAVQGAAEVAGEEAIRGAGGLLGALRDLVIGGSSSSTSTSRHEHPHGTAAATHEERRGYSDAPAAIADLGRGGGDSGRSSSSSSSSFSTSGSSTQPMQQQQQRYDDDVSRRAQETAEDVSRRVGDAGAAVADAAAGAADAAAGNVREAADEAAVVGGGLLNTLRNLLVGGGGGGGGSSDRDDRAEERERERQEQERERHQQREQRRRGHQEAEVEQAEKRERERAMAPAGPPGDEGFDAEGLGRGLGEVVGGVKGVLEKIQHVGADTAPQQPVVPYTSTAELLAARQQQQEQEER